MFSPPHYCCPDVHEKQCRYERLRKPVARDRISVPTARTLQHARTRSFGRGVVIGAHTWVRPGRRDTSSANTRARGSRKACPDRMDTAAGPEPHAIWSLPDDVIVTITRTGLAQRIRRTAGHTKRATLTRTRFCVSHIIIRHIHSYNDNYDTICNDDQRPR